MSDTAMPATGTGTLWADLRRRWTGGSALAVDGHMRRGIGPPPRTDDPRLSLLASA